MTTDATWLHLSAAHGFYDWTNDLLARKYPELAREDGRVDVDGLHDRDHQVHAGDLDHDHDGDDREAAADMAADAQYRAHLDHGEA